jgi:hypothetical protein
MTYLSPIRRVFILALSLSIAACGGDAPQNADSTDPNNATTTTPTSTAEAISPTEADSEPKTKADESPSEGAEASDIREAKGGDPALLLGKWEPIAYVRPDGVEMDLVDLPEAERTDLSWEFGDDGSVQAGSSIGTFEVKDTSFIATNKATGEARTFRYTVTDTNLWVINPAGDVLKLQRAQ